ncbi:hypothetical protein Tco_0748419 [Tanacetum coccineum]|uniref:Uncharacterized protein n=1 Tax=Tanacetum coccineum TaxID=301880 RepID=A0ABQ4YYZ5_9ASTR
MIPKTERLQEYMRLQGVSYGISYYARPLLLFFSSENRLLWLRDHDKHHDDAHPDGENSAMWQKVSEHGTYTLGESLSEQAMNTEPNPLGSVTQEQIDEFDAWMDGFGTYDDEVPTEEVSQEL